MTIKHQSTTQSISYPDFALHTLGWKAFQDLCAQICSKVLNNPVSVYREAQDGGQDAVLRDSNEQGDFQLTVQCKFSSKAEKRLKLSDIDSELKTISKLLEEGKADKYYFITSMGVDAPVAHEIVEQLKSKGISDAQVYGKEWITQQIRSNAELRALVPRVYGLGDLSTILDERIISQTNALLGHLQKSLKVYVPTKAHRNAVNILSENKIVLLLGAPATGKSMLAAILATMAIDKDNDLECLKCDGPSSMSNSWNPHNQKRLYWVDDAFGPSQMRADYVDAWISFIPKMKAAIEKGSYFILTSRTHIWNEAKNQLGTRNHPLLANNTAVVNVGELSSEERQQILYNHVKAGNQTEQWKLSIKPHLDAMARKSELLPEIARRLGDSSFTSGIRSIPYDLVNFIQKPQDFLKVTIQELGSALQAAMILVFLARSRLPLQKQPDKTDSLVADKHAIPQGSLYEGLKYLNGSFLVQREENNVKYWSFIHPTFADAISSILRDNPDFIEIYVRGVKLEVLLSEAVCEGAPPIKDAVIIPEDLFDDLIVRLRETPNEPNSNKQLFIFLTKRASIVIVVNLLKSMPDLLNREVYSSNYEKLLFLAKINSIGLLSESMRSESYKKIEDRVQNKLDLSFLDYEKIMGLLTPSEFMNIMLEAVSLLSDKIPEEIAFCEENADPDGYIEDNFSHITMFLETLEHFFFERQDTYDIVKSLIQDVEYAIKRVAKNTPEEEEEENIFSNMTIASIEKESSSRSIFSDVDE